MRIPGEIKNVAVVGAGLMGFSDLCMMAHGLHDGIHHGVYHDDAHKWRARQCRAACELAQLCRV